ncbi:MAG: hypothetical protein Q9225_007224 [Loekoesia sp. 1 TL-2023]
MQIGSRRSSLLRAQTSLLVFLAPCISSTSSATAFSPCRTYLAIANIAKSQRLLSTQGGFRQASLAAAAAQQPSSQADTANSGPQPFLKSSRRSADETRNRHSAFLDRIRNPSRNEATPKSREDADREIDVLLNNGVGSKKGDTKFESPADYVERKRAEERRKDFAAAQQSKGRQGSIARGMLMPRAINAPAEQQSTAIELPEATRAAATIKSRPSLGRTVEVIPERGLDLGRALRSLEINCNVNNVKADSHKQRFYERPGLKRKRLKSVRWRRTFKIGFKAVVAKVKAMRRKGW